MSEGNDSAAELLEALEELESGLLEFERAIAKKEDARPLVHALFRIAHNLKSGFAFQSLAGASKLFHAVETCLDRLRGGLVPATPPLIDLLMRAVDAGRDSTVSRNGERVADEALRQALLSFGAEADEEDGGGSGPVLAPATLAALEVAMAPGWTAWVLEKSVGPGIDEVKARELPIFDTLAALGTIVHSEVRRRSGSEGILVMVFATGLAEKELRLSVFDPLIPLRHEAVTPPRPRILAVDDERLILDLMRIALAARGNVDTVNSGGEAIARFRGALAAKPYDAVFLDLMLEDRSGLEVLHAMRTAETEAGLPPGRGAKIAIVTSIKDYGTISDAFRNQCDLYLVKPLTEESLHEAMVKFGFAAYGGRKTENLPNRTPETGMAQAPWRGRKDSEEPQGKPEKVEVVDIPPDPFLELGALGRLLERAPTIEELCRLTVEKGRSFLSLDRMAVFLFDPAKESVKGTTGVDPEGRVVDESDFRMTLPDDPLFVRFHEPGAALLQIDEDRPLKFRDRVVGRGWTAVFPLRSGAEILGWIKADNLKTGQALLPVQRWLFALFGQLVEAQLIHKRSKDELVEAIAKLSAESLKRESELRRLTLEAAEQSAVKERLFSIFAHDLRGPLGAVKGMLDLALDGAYPLSEEELRESLPEMRSAVASSWSLLENLLDWVRSQLTEISELHDKVDLAETGRSAMITIKPLADKKRVDLVLDIPSDLSVLADTRIVEAIIRNFIANAVKFSPSGSAILIHGARDQERQETILAVTDRGVGMSAEQISRLFTMDPSKKRKGTAGESGSGIGLLFCSDLARHIGGRIEVESEVGHGSSFSLVIPEVAEGLLEPI